MKKGLEEAFRWMRRLIYCCLLTFGITASVVADDVLPAPVNLDFEAGIPGAPPPGWVISPGDGSGNLVVETMGQDCAAGARCARLLRKDTGSGYSALVQVVRADSYRGRRLRLEGRLHLVGGEGRAFLYLQINGREGRPQTSTGQTAGTSWRVDALIADVPADAETLQFGLVVSGAVEAWIDGVRVDVLGDAGAGNEPPRPLINRGAENLKALTRLVGLVRYFHPSDRSAQLDWPAWTLEAVDEVEGAQDGGDLATLLARLVRPIAPTVQIFRTGETPLSTSPVAASDSHPLAWRHYGLATGSSRSAANFSSRRVGGFTKPEGSGVLTWILNASDLRGKTLRLTAAARLEGSGATPGQGELWLLATGRDGRPLAEERRSVKDGKWEDFKIEQPIPAQSASILLGIRLTEGGPLFLDKVHVTAIGGPDSHREILAEDFEKGAPGEFPEGWFESPESRAAGYYATISEERPRDGRRCLRIAWSLDVELPDAAAPLTLDLGGGASVRMPVALFTDSQGTLPHGASAVLFDHRKPQGFLPSGKDRATRITGVLLLWAALNHFYPYPLEASWSPSLDRALHSAATDVDERAFLDTLRRMLADLRDNHATVTHSSDNADYRLPILWSWVDGRLVVAWTELDTVHVGDIIERVDGTAVPEALALLEPLVSGATPAYRRYRALELLAAAPKDTARTLLLRRGARTFPVTLHATAHLFGPDRLRGHRPEKIAELRPGLFYIDLDRIDDQDFDAALPRLARARGLIFDLRGYPERISEILLAHLLSAPARTPGTWTSIRTRPDLLPKWDHLAWTIQPLQPRLAARAVFLTDERAYSRAETYLDIVSFYHLGDIVGATTGGTNGEVNDMDLPGGYHVTWTGNRVERLSGTQLQRVGIPPTLAVVPSLKGVAEGRDEVLERAVAFFP